MDRAIQWTAAFLLTSFVASSGVAAAPPGGMPADCPYMKDGMMHGPACEDGADCPAGPGGMMGHQHGGHWMSGMDELNLTAEQRASMKQVFERYRTRGAELAERGSAVRTDLMNVAPDDAGYDAAIDSAADRTAEITADAVRLMSEMRKELHAILTEEQRAQLKERMTTERQRWDEWRNRHKAPAN